jgi:hypothetical protein
MDVKELLINYGWVLALCIGIGVGYYIFYKKYGKAALFTKMREDAYKLMLAAEQKFGAKNGKTKFAWVVERFYPMIPKSVKIFWTQADLEEFVQKTFDKSVDFLDDGKLNNSNVEVK